MSTIRVAKRTRFTTVARQTVNDARLSFRARGVLVWLLDKPDDWSARATSIAECGREGRDAIRAALRELESLGYIVRERRQVDRGRWVTETVVYEKPAEDGIPGVGEPGVGPPGVGESGALLPVTDNEDCQRKSVAPAAPTRRDLLFEALAEVCGIDLAGLTDSARGALNNARRQIAAVGGTPVEVRSRAAVYRQRMPEVELTPSALAKHWPRMNGDHPVQRRLPRGADAIERALADRQAAP